MTTPRSSFVTVMAWISIALGAMGVASGLLQAAMLPSLPMDRFMQELAAAGMALPPLLQRIFAHLQLLNAVSLLGSALFAWVSWALLQRREWARLAFIGFLALGVLGGIAAVVAMQPMLDWANSASGMAEIDPLLRGVQSAMKAAAWLSVLLVAVLHGAIIWKLCTPAIRAEFSRA